MRFRPLAAATLGSGAVALAVLQFAAESWGDFPPEARQLTAAGGRTALLAFLMSATVLLGCYLAERLIGPVVRAIANLYGSAVFFTGTFIAGSAVSRALDIAGGDGAPPDQVTAFLGIAGIGWLTIALLIAGLTGGAAWRALAGRARAPAAQIEEEASDEQA